MLVEKIEAWTVVYDEWQRLEHLDATLEMETVVRLLFAAELGLAVYEALGIEAPEGTAAGDVVACFLDSLGGSQQSESGSPIRA